MKPNGVVHIIGLAFVAERRVQRIARGFMGTAAMVTGFGYKVPSLARVSEVANGRNGRGCVWWLTGGRLARRLLDCCSLVFGLVRVGFGNGV